MYCNNKIFNKFLLLSFIFLIMTVCCNTLFVSASTPRQNRVSKDPVHNVHVQQKEIISDLRRIENKLKK